VPYIDSTVCVPVLFVPVSLSESFLLSVAILTYIKYIAFYYDDYTYIAFYYDDYAYIAFYYDDYAYIPKS